MTREELKKKQYDDKVKKGLKTLKFRKFKNFLFWLLGVVCMPIILVLTMFVGIKVIPMKVYFGGQESQYVSESISNKSILDAILSFNDYTFDELVFVEDLVAQLENTDIGDGKKLGDWVTFDTEKLKGLHFTEIASVISSCIVVNASLDNTIGLETLGDIDKIKAFSSWEKVPNQTAENLSNFDLSVETCNPNLYWIPVGVSSGVTPQSTAPTAQQTSLEYEVAFVTAEDGSFLVQNGKYVLKNGAWGNLCYANISEVPFTVVLDIIDETLPRIALKDILSLAGINPPAEGENNILYTILGDKIIGDFSGDFKIEDFASGLTLENLGVSELLGDFGSLSLFTWQEVDMSVEIETAVETFSPKLYYYLTDNGEYELAFEDADGDGVYMLKLECQDPNPEQLYYANLSCVPVLDILTLINESIPRIDLGEVLSFAGITDENNLLVQILGDKTVGDLSGEIDIAELVGDITLEDVGVSELLGDFSSLSLFNWQQVESDVIVNPTDENFNPKLYYYIASPDMVDENGALTNDAYELAFEDADGDGVFALKQNAVEPLYYANLSCVPVLDLVTLMNESIVRIEIGEVLSIAGITDENNLIVQILGDKTVGDLSGEIDIANLVSGVTLDGLGIDELLGDFSSLSLFTWQEVESDKVIDPTSEAFNPKLYYYVAYPEMVDGEVLSNDAYELAFEVNSDGVYSLKADAVGKPLYYANLSCVPVLDLVTLMNESIVRIEIDELLSFAGITGENNLIVQIFSGLTIGDFSNGVDLEKLLGKVSLSTIEGGLEVLGDIGELSVISTWQEVESDIVIDPTSEAFNPKLYYYIAYPENTEGGLLLDSAFDLAFESGSDGKYALKENAVGAQLYYAKLACVPLSDITSLIGETLGRIRFDEIFEIVGIEKPVLTGETNILYEVLGDKCIKDVSGDFDATNLLADVSLDDLGGRELLGDLATLSMFDIWEEAGYPAQINTASENFNPKLYYYIAHPEMVENGMLLDSAYELAYEDKGNGFYNIKDGVDPYNTTIYYAKLSSIPFMDMTSLLSESLGRLDIIELLNTLGDAGITEDSLIFDILDGSTLNQLGDLSEKINSVKLTNILKEEDNKDLYKILNSVLNKGEDGVINIGDLNTFKIDNLDLETVLDRASNTELYKILDSVIDKGTDGKINISDLSSFKIDNLDLETVLTRSSNADLYKILDSVIDKGTDGKINIKDLSSFKIDNLDLETVLTRSSNADLYKILDSVIDKGTDGKINIKDLSSFSINNLDLEVVLDRSSNVDLYKILDQVIEKGTDGKINIKDLSTFSINKISLSTVLDPSANEKLYSILVEGINGKRLTDSDPTNNDKLVSITTLTILDIKDFSVDSIKLATVLTPHDNLKNILEQMTGTDFENITISTLSGELSFDNIYLSVVMPYSASNKTLYSVLLQGKGFAVTDANIEQLASNLKISDIKGGIDFTKIRLSTLLTNSGDNDILDKLLEDDTVTLGNIGEKINNLSVTEIYGVNCFVKDNASEKAKYYKDSNGNFYLVGGALTPSELNGTTTYSISTDAKIWLFLAYAPKEEEIERKKSKFDENGNALSYGNKDLKFKDIASSITGMTGGILDATIRQLEDCGILAGPYNPLLYPQSISQIIDSANSKIPEIPVPQS